MYFETLSKIYANPVTLIRDVTIFIAVLCCSFGALHWSQSSFSAARIWFVIAATASVYIGMWHTLNPDAKMDKDMHMKRVELVLGVPFVLVSVIALTLSGIPSETSDSGAILGGPQFLSWICGVLAGWVLTAASAFFGTIITQAIKPKTVEG